MESSDEHESEEERTGFENEKCESDYNESAEEKNKQGNPGWADAMARILGKQIPEDKPAVLIKYKKAEREMKRKLDEDTRQKMVTQEKHATREKNHIKPTVTNDENERRLRRIATKGVVKLFNAVNKQQKEVEAKLKRAPTEAKKARVLKSVSKTSFLDMLKNNPNNTLATGNGEKLKEDKVARWNILREDFMMGGKMKDWDKEDDDLEYDNEDNRQQVIESDNEGSE